ncbi:MAG: hypothetical protein ACREQA_01725 [Candidatus Binatia bacterium]
MKNFKLVLYAMLLAGTVTPLPAAPQGVILSARVTGTDYCHLRFPAIREQTLYSDHPVLKDPSDGDIIDFYGACDHDPLGKEEIQAQRYHFEEQRRPRG